MVRKTNRKIFLLALGITLIVFIGGLYAGILINKQKVSHLRESFIDSQRKFEKYRVSLMLQDSLPEKSCEVLEYRNKDIVDEISNINEKISEYDRTKKFERPEEFKDLREDYTLLYIQYWLQMKRAKKDCGSNITTVLYLFSDEECARCKDQGKVLDYWKEQYDGGLLVFPLTVDLDLDSVEMIEKSYGIEKLPAIVVNGNKTYEGFQSKRKLGEIFEESK